MQLLPIPSHHQVEDIPHIEEAITMGEATAEEEVTQVEEDNQISFWKSRNIELISKS